jgi:hypothetical protein
MQNAATVLGVLRERGRRGLPLEELYRQLEKRRSEGDQRRRRSRLLVGLRRPAAPGASGSAARTEQRSSAPSRSWKQQVPVLLAYVEQLAGLLRNDSPKVILPRRPVDPWEKPEQAIGQ